MDTFISHSPEETAALGQAWGETARPGWLIGLTGELGAGKTQLVKGLARGLGIGACIQSPTFALVREYSGGRLPLAHLDLYRLAGAEEVARAGLDAYLWQPAGVTVVEWIERCLDWQRLISGKSPQPFRHVRFEQLSEDERRILYEDFGH